MKKSKCKKCGATFYYDDMTPTEGLKDFAKDVIPGAGFIFRGPKICPDCKRLEETNNSGKSKSRSGGGLLNISNSESPEKIAELEKQRAKREDAVKSDNERQDISNLNIEGNSDEIQSTLNNLVSRAAGLKGGLFGNAQDKQTLKVIKEKLEFGIMKLRSMGNNNEADYFQSKLDKIK
ncbi:MULTISPECIES: hypothetical protein [Treponema]|uniref:Uncharacterized protein n=1 Tax=Treponema putidum TaxID=221027 RepID=A0ABY5HTY7_9SPIR|nr:MULTISPECIES: hypothetical protein [Treponema]UTC78724.1 hypothetical protein E4O04_12265 [Treponema sp. OMZ 799]UTY28851.1 hypothetical protein E4N76_07515 [Treponema putidum]